MSEKPLPELQRVRLKSALLPAGATGTIVHVYDKGGYEIEFALPHGPALVTVGWDDVEMVS